MTDSRPELNEVLRQVLDSWQNRMHTALPARVTQYFPDSQLVNVQPMVKNVIFLPTGDEIEESLPELLGIPLVFPRSSRYFLSFPVKPGAFVLVVFCERSIDRFLEKGTESHPIDADMHGLSGAVAFPGLYPDGRALGEADADKMVLGMDGGSQIRISDDGSVQIGSVNGTYEKVAHAQKVNDRISNLETEHTKLSGLYNSHIHVTTATIGPSPVVGVLAPTASQDAPGLTPGSDVSCSKVEVE